jgi:hypothetical protein
MCLRKLTTFLDSLKNLPLNMLAPLIPKCPPQLAMLGGMASGIATVQAMASAQAHLSAALKLGLPAFPIPPLDLGKLEAMAYLAGTTGANALHANMALTLQRMATSINVNLPSIMQLAMELLQPVIDPLMDLLEWLHSFDAVHTTFGINLALHGSMPKLTAVLAARANVRMAATLDVQAAMNLGTYARMMRAAAALGFNLDLPGMAARLSAAMNLAAGLPIPPLKIDLPQMNTLGNLLTALSPIQKSILGINMRLPNAFNLLAAAIKALLANLLEPLNLSAAEMESLSESSRLGSQCSGVPSALGLGLQLKAMAGLRLRGLPFDLLPDLGPLAAAARFGQATGLSVWSSSPCTSRCPVGKMF